MTIKAIYDTQDEIPANVSEYYTERNGKWELTEVEGIKTDADITRVTEALNNEKRKHAETKSEFKPFRDLGIPAEELRTSIDSIPDLQAQLEAAGDGPDQEKIDQLVDAKLQAALKPIQRDLDAKTAELAEITADRDGLKIEKNTRIIHDAAREAAVEMKIIPEAMPDVLLYAERLFQINDDNEVETKDGVGVTPMVDAKEWLTEWESKRPHWFPGSEGSGARGGNGNQPGGGDHSPWTAEGWNVTKQNQLERELGPDKAGALAKRAGTGLGGTRPLAKA